MSSKTEAQLHFEKEKQAYWAMRDKLLKQYKGKWVAVVNKQAVAIGDKMNKVMEESFQKTRSKVMFVGRVGYENRVALIRQDYFKNIEFKIGEPSALYSNNSLMKALNRNL